MHRPDDLVRHHSKQESQVQFSIESSARTVVHMTDRSSNVEVMALMDGAYEATVR